MTELTEQHLKIPHAVAARYAAPGTNAYEELVSAGNEGLVRGWRRFDPARGVLAQHLFVWVKAYVRRATGRYAETCRGHPLRRSEWKWRHMVSLDAPTGASGVTMGELIAGVVVPPPDDDHQEEIDRVLRRLPPLWRAAYVMRHGRGMRVNAIALAFGRDRGTVRGWLESAETKVAAVVAAAGRNFRRGNNQPSPPRTVAQRKASSKSRLERAAADRALGDVPARRNCWYLADDVARTLEGPGALAALLARHGITGETRGPGKTAAAQSLLAAEGLRAARGPEARRLAKYEGYRLAAYVPPDQQRKGAVA